MFYPFFSSLRLLTFIFIAIICGLSVPPRAFWLRVDPNATISRISVASDGTEGNRPSYFPSLSDGGRYVAFISAASNLVPGDSNVNDDVFVYDRQTCTTSRISVADDGAQGNAPTERTFPTISNDGRYVAFVSEASNLVPDDTNRAQMFSSMTVRMPKYSEFLSLRNQRSN